MPGYRDVEGTVIAVLHFGRDGTVAQRSWAVSDASGERIARLLGPADAETVLTAEQLDASNAALGDVPQLWRAELA